MTRVVLVEPLETVREALRLLLEANRCEVVGTAASGPDALPLIERAHYDLVVSETRLPRLSGPDLLLRARRNGSDCPTLFLTSDESRCGVERALRAGASGYVVKSAPPEELLEGIRTVARGRSYIGSAVAHHVVGALSDDRGSRARPTTRLSSRERETLQLVAEGLSTRSIAAQMGVTPKTAESYRAALMRKMGTHKVASLVRAAIREGMIEA